jgi:hypothetical protein
MAHRRYSILLSAAMLAASFAAPSHSEEITIQPRVTIGRQEYEFDYGDLVIGNSFNDDIFIRDGFKFRDSVAFTGAGLTIGWRRFFFDVSTQRSRTGNDSGIQYWSPLPLSFLIANGADPFFAALADGQNHLVESKFKRKEMNYSLGWAATPNMSVYVGYKDSQTDFSNSLVPVLLGPTQLFSVNLYDTYIFGTQKDELTYDGFFVGATYSVPVASWGGAFSLQASVASLDGTVTARFNGQTFISVPNINQPLLELNPSLVGLNGRDTGDSLGTNMGISWTGNFGWLSERLRNLSYTVGIDRSEYKFKSDGQPNDFQEIIVRGRVDLRYAFSFGGSGD